MKRHKSRRYDNYKPVSGDAQDTPDHSHQEKEKKRYRNENQQSMTGTFKEKFSEGTSFLKANFFPILFFLIGFGIYGYQNHYNNLLAGLNFTYETIVKPAHRGVQSLYARTLDKNQQLGLELTLATVVGTQDAFIRQKFDEKLDVFFSILLPVCKEKITKEQFLVKQTELVLHWANFIKTHSNGNKNYFGILGALKGIFSVIDKCIESLKQKATLIKSGQENQLDDTNLENFIRGCDLKNINLM